MAILSRRRFPANRRDLGDMCARRCGRSAWARTCWKIALERGKIVERGTHEELVEAGGYYAALCQKQMLEEELEAI